MKRPGGWVDGIGWVAVVRDLADGDKFAYTATENHQLNRTASAWWRREAHRRPVIVTRWADGTIPEPPQKPTCDYGFPAHGETPCELAHAQPGGNP